VIAESSRTRAATGETSGRPMAVTFASLGGFADVLGMGISTEYVAQRTGEPGGGGWTTHAITPPQEPLTLRAATQNLDPLYEGELSPDLSRGIFRAWSPLTAAPNVLEVENLYLREDLRTPGAGLYRLLTDAPAPLDPIAASTERPYVAAATDDLEHVLFESRLPLVPGTNRGNQILYKAHGGVVTALVAGTTCPAVREPAVTTAPCSGAGLGVSALRRTERTLSADGSRVIFTAPVAGGGSVQTAPGAESLLYQHDDQGTPTTADDTVVQVNASEKAVPSGLQAAFFLTASTSGERIFFTTREHLTDTPGSGLYLWRRVPTGGKHLTLIAEANDPAVVGASEDGRRVYFTALGQLVPGGPALRQYGLYLWQDAEGPPGGTLSFVGALPIGDVLTNVNGQPWSLIPRVSRVTPDGRIMLFTASDGSGLAPGRDHGSCPSNPSATSNGRCSQLYLYRADGSTPLAPNIVCVSCPPSGAGTANAFVNVRAGAGASPGTTHLSRALTDDGRRVFFSSAQALMAGDANGKVDAYEYDVPSGRLQLLSDGRDADDAWFLDASATGDDVFFITRARLVGWDVDQAYDLYDARVGGGFPEPPTPPAPCTGDACRGLPSAVAPPLPGLGSAAIAGAAGRRGTRSAPARRCRRGVARRRASGRGGRARGRRRCARRRGARARARARARRGRR
jgi:hypothetical protein